VLRTTEQLEGNLGIVDDYDRLSEDRHRADGPVFVFVLQPVMRFESSFRFGEVVDIAEQRQALRAGWQWVVVFLGAHEFVDQVHDNDAEKKDETSQRYEGHVDRPAESRKERMGGK
jgi:hypothetical protein